MKIFTAALFLMTAGITVTEASDSKDYDGATLELLNKVAFECPLQFIQAMKGANQIISARLMTDRASNVYSIQFVKTMGPLLPAYQSIATLNMVQTFGTNPEEVKMTCEIVEARK